MDHDLKPISSPPALPSEERLTDPGPVVVARKLARQSQEGRLILARVEAGVDEEKVTDSVMGRSVAHEGLEPRGQCLPQGSERLGWREPSFGINLG